MSIQIITADSRMALGHLPPSSVHCCVTSPPYFGLRDYGHADQIGLEQTPDAFITELVGVFREVRRVLRDDGTLWVNIGDSYAGSRSGPDTGSTLQGSRNNQNAAKLATTQSRRRDDEAIPRSDFRVNGLKPKDLIGAPWMLAFALRADGWYLRQDIIWSKPNPMPESVRDRCTKSHEYLFLLSKSERYYCDMEAIAEPLAATSIARLSQPTLNRQAGSTRVPGKTNGTMKAVGPRFGGDKYGDSDARESRTKSGAEWTENETGKRNKRSVWTVATQPFSEAHFATFPPALIEPCILAGCPVGGTVLDPFGGAGTTGLAADRLGRNAVLIEINAEYAQMAERRISSDAPLFSQVESA